VSKCKTAQILEFCLQGRFVGFILEDGYKIKGLRLATAEGECCIKLSKSIRGCLSQGLIAGDWIEVSGERILDWKRGQLKLKAYEVKLIRPSHAGLTPPVAAKPAKPQACILVCEKSDCCQKGAMEVCKALAGELRDRGLEQSVTIKKTGCMKQCKAGPNIVIMPDKTNYRRVSPQEIPDLIEKHFAQPVGEATLVG
jgi:(2Fe-2S) ferredoxin